MIQLRFNFRMFLYGALYLAGVVALGWNYFAGKIESATPQGLSAFVGFIAADYMAVLILSLIALAPGLFLVVLSLLPRIRIFPWK